MKSIIRVFPRETSFTPRDEMAFVGEPQMFRPPADEVHISCTFTWDRKYSEHLGKAWNQYYPVVKVGGPAFNDKPNGFTAGMYVRSGVTFTSRGCNNRCPWCLVPEREGKLREYTDLVAGNIVQDNNLLQCERGHLTKVFQMLRSQRDIEFTGGLDARLLSQAIADELRSLRIHQLFFACDTKESLRTLHKAATMLTAFTRQHLRCYVLLAFGGQTISEATEHLENVWEAGFVPHAQLFQPPDHWIEYSQEWQDLNRTWARPAAMAALHKQEGVLVS